MRRPKFLLVTAFLIATETAATNVTANAQQKAFHRIDKSNNAVSSAMEFTPVAHKRVEPLEQAFQDAISILSKNNSCSRFYGDTKMAEEVLRRLATQFRFGLLRDSRTGIEMSGNFTFFDKTEKPLECAVEPSENPDHEERGAPVKYKNISDGQRRSDKAARTHSIFGELRSAYSNNSSVANVCMSC